MLKVRHILPCVLLALIMAAMVHDANAQARDTTRQRVVDLSANSLEGDVIDGQRVNRLVGDVHLRQDETRLWANRAVQYVDREEILFLGSVRIVERGDSLSADSVLYNTRTKIGEASGNVRLSDGEVEAFAPSGRYFTQLKRAVFDAGVTLVDSASVLTSQAGEYWSDEKRAEFFGEVLLEEDRTRLEADSVTYYRETEVSVARGNVSIERLGDDDGELSDSTRTLLFGAYAYNDNRLGFSRIEGDPLLVQLRRDSTAAPTDTLLIRAVTIEASRQDSLRRLVAVDSVRIWQREFAAVADSLVFDRIRLDAEETLEEARLFRDPVAWFEGSEAAGDTMRVTGRSGSIDSLFVRGRSFAARLDSVSGRIQQLRGRRLLALFEDDSLRTLTMGPNAEAVYYLTRDEQEPNGAVSMSADRIVFHFSGDELLGVDVVQGVEGTYYAEDLLPDNLQLEGYRWEPERRPTREGLLEGRVFPDAPERLAEEWRLIDEFDELRSN